MSIPCTLFALLAALIMVHISSKAESASFSSTKETPYTNIGRTLLGAIPLVLSEKELLNMHNATGITTAYRSGGFPCFGKYVRVVASLQQSAEDSWEWGPEQPCRTR